MVVVQVPSRATTEQRLVCTVKSKTAAPITFDVD
jgi:hypothetical protein